MMLFRPVTTAGGEPWVKLFVAAPRLNIRQELTEEQYLRRLRDIYNVRNPHFQIGVEKLEGEDEELGPM